MVMVEVLLAGLGYMTRARNAQTSFTMAYLAVVTSPLDFENFDFPIVLSIHGVIQAA